MSEGTRNASAQPARIALRIAFIYLALSALWIYFSDRILALLFDDLARLTLWQTAKGWGFVLLSGALIFFLVRGALRDAYLAHRQVRRLNEELEQRVAERTAQLQAANQELKAFSYSVSHDLKAPLRGIEGYSRLLEEECPDRLSSEGRRFVANIREGVSRMDRLIEDLLAYAHMEQRMLHAAAIDVEALVREVAADREKQVALRGGQLCIEVCGIRARADHEGLAIVLRNLLDNALKFSDENRPVRIEVGGRIEGEKALLWIRDNGIGFDAKFRDRIFDIFQRLHLAEDYPGTGIGLALVRRAMQRMGGRVWAEAAEGVGAVFYLELPAA
ncbi:sensor histidine kinase [Geoalkalibacter halelectricus]|uniref:histidine kinase n=1 Tax=Geoalkalibacter halelectricus TaxID=2847045 RepID=A0ABY5ZRX9_9BACT|nr:ATP-binding protein [Geoalkalibacter halelectricus]MDO3379856.1 ATP-binding protein [Geoalkalibacter halelectricus]UWZ80615.1 ATP-binding protein [Geoalkalibacter halelectricus]